MQTETAYTNIDIDTYQAQFQTNGQTYFLLDVREPGEYRQGRIPGAVNIPLGDLPDRMGEVPNDHNIVIVCARGGRSTMVAEFLSENGFQKLYNLVDGTIGWQMRGLPLEG